MGKSGLLSSAAAAAVLTLASGCVLLLTTSVVAFRGWPSVRDADGAQRVTLAAAPDSTRRPQRVVLGEARPGPARRSARKSSPVRRRRTSRVAPLRTQLAHRARRSSRPVTAAAAPRAKVRVPPVVESQAPAAPAPTVELPVATAVPTRGTLERVVDQIDEQVDELVQDVAGPDGLIPLLAP